MQRLNPLCRNAMRTSFRVILIPIILFFAVLSPVLAQTPQLSLTLIGQDAGHYVVPAGQTTELKMEILNVAPSDVYLSEGNVYLDPGLNGNWELIHSESLGNFHLGYLQSAIWTFELAMPAMIQAANVTSGTPQVSLLIKITYLTATGIQQVEQNDFPLTVPGASVQQQNNSIWLATVGVIALIGIGGAAYVTLKKKRQTR